MRWEWREFRGIETVSSCLICRTTRLVSGIPDVCYEAIILWITTFLCLWRIVGRRTGIPRVWSCLCLEQKSGEQRRATGNVLLEGLDIAVLSYPNQFQLGAARIDFA